MGVLNVTPDSFSDGGAYLAPATAVAHGVEMFTQGADIVDVGGESTRPRAAAVPAGEEIRRAVPVIRGILERLPGAVCSIDTSKAAVAAAALDAGARIVNDVSAGTADAEMFAVVADHDAGYVAMHMQGTPRTMQDEPRYDDVVREVGDYLVGRLDAAGAAGIRDDALFADPGIGFGKTIEHNLALLRALPALVARVGVPVCIGASRKSFLGVLTGGAPATDREEATLATTVWAFERGVRAVRVHDVAGSWRAARLLQTMARATQAGVAA